MTRLLLVTLLLLGCSTDGGDDTRSKSTEEANEASLYCCTMQEYCRACGCTTAETQIFESKVESACEQLLDSAEYSCADGDETTALAQCVSGSNTPNNPTPSANPCDGDETQGDDCQESGVDSDTGNEPTETVPPPDPDVLEALRRAELALCNFRQRCLPASAIETEDEGGVEACVARITNTYELGYYGLAGTATGAAECYDALLDLECARLDSRETDAQDQLQWFRQQSEACAEFFHSCVSDSECGVYWECSNEDGQCGACLLAGSTEACVSERNCALGDACVAGQCKERVSLGQACTDSAECVNGWCESGLCVPIVPLGGECGGAYKECGMEGWCSSDGVCEQQGAIGDHCEPHLWYAACRLGLYCVEDQCQPWGPYYSAGEFESCFISENCVRGMHCNEFHCRLGDRNACTANTECAKDEYCAPLCDVAQDCAAQCDRTEYEVELCVEGCASDQDCIDLCSDEAACLDDCNANPPACAERECRPKQPLGGACAVRTDCESDACSDDRVCIERASCE